MTKIIKNEAFYSLKYSTEAQFKLKQKQNMGSGNMKG